MTYYDDIRDVLSDKNLTFAARCIWIYMHDKQGANQDCWPSIETICRDCGTTRPTAVRAIRELEAAGRLLIDRPKNPSIGHSNKYRISKESKPVKNLNQLRNLTRTSKEPLPEPVKKLNPNDPLTSHKRPNPKDTTLFDSFWKAYPKKVSKENALKAFKKINPTESLLNEMLKALDRQKMSPQWTKDNGQYIPYPATWLNGRRWDDETTTTEGGFIPNDPTPEQAERILRQVGAA